MTDKTEDRTNVFNVCVPDDLWPDINEGVAKVVLSGIGANTLPPDIFLIALIKNGIITDDDISNTRVNIPFSKRKRLVYGNLKYKHKQTFEFQYQGNTITFILFDPNDSRAELTLLHMPINTTPEVISYIFNAINPNWKTSEIRLEPGVEQRHDRWQLMLECSDRNEIPHYIGLPKRGAEKEDLKIKVFVTGRVSPCVHCQGDHRSNKCTNPPPRPEPRRAADSQTRDTAGVQHQSFELDEIKSTQPEKFKQFIETICDNQKLPACEILKKMLFNHDSPIDIVENCEIDNDELKAKGEPIMFSRSKEPPLFTNYPVLDNQSKVSEEETSPHEQVQKQAASMIFLQLFKCYNMNDKDWSKMKDFVFGKSSFERTAVWLCQIAEFLETGNKQKSGEMPVIENATY